MTHVTRTHARKLVLVAIIAANALAGGLIVQQARAQSAIPSSRCLTAGCRCVPVNHVCALSGAGGACSDSNQC